MIATYKRLKQQRAVGETDGGFTLIELLIVIIVLGILAAVVIFALGGVTGKSAKAACQVDGATVSTAMAALNAQHPGYLSAVTANTVGQEFLVKTAAGETASALTSSLANVTAGLGGPYIQSWPNNTQHYVFSITNGQLKIKIGTAAPVNYDGPGTCSTVK